MSCSPKVIGDQVIGVFYKDTTPKYSKHLGAIANFKQDFIVRNGNIFTAYISKNLVKNSPNVKNISEFFRVYGEENKYYYKGKLWNHEYANSSDLPSEIIII